MGNKSDRDTAPGIPMDLRIPDEEIQRRLRERFTSRAYPFMWWELEPGNRVGYVYSGKSPDLAIGKLVHVTMAHKLTTETRNGTGPVPQSLMQKWSCTCGSSSGEGWRPYKTVQEEVRKHQLATGANPDCAWLANGHEACVVDSGVWCVPCQKFFGAPRPGRSS